LLSIFWMMMMLFGTAIFAIYYSFQNKLVYIPDIPDVPRTWMIHPREYNMDHL